MGAPLMVKLLPPAKATVEVGVTVPKVCRQPAMPRKVREAAEIDGGGGTNTEGR